MRVQVRWSFGALPVWPLRDPDDTDADELYFDELISELLRQRL